MIYIKSTPMLFISFILTVRRNRLFNKSDTAEGIIPVVGPWWNWTYLIIVNIRWIFIFTYIPLIGRKRINAWQFFTVVSVSGAISFILFIAYIQDHRFFAFKLLLQNFKITSKFSRKFMLIRREYRYLYILK